MFSAVILIKLSRLLHVLSFLIVSIINYFVYFAAFLPLLRTVCVCFMLRRPSPSLLCSVYHTKKLFVIKKFYFLFFYSLLTSERAKKTVEDEELNE